MTFEKPGLDAFVPYGDDRAETARTLTNLADKHNISQNDIHAANDGFYITEALADLLYEDGDESGDGDEPTADDPDPIARDREIIREAESNAAFTQAVADDTYTQGVENEVQAADLAAANEAEAARQAEEKAAQAAADADESEEAETENTEVETESANKEEQTAPIDYSEWEYAALNHEVAERGLEVEDRKTETLIAALTADDNEIK